MDPKVSVEVTVKNSGDTYAGKEVVQIYASCPQGKLVKEFRRLAGFGKTKLLAPGEEQQMTITFPLYQLLQRRSGSMDPGTGQIRYLGGQRVKYFRTQRCTGTGSGSRDGTV